MLPVQCLCEFLLNDSLNASSSVRDEDGSLPPVATAGNKSAKKQRKAGELLVHLQQLLQNPNSDPASCLETLDYFLRRLGSLQSPARLQALAGLKLLLTPDPQRAEEDRRPMEDDSGSAGRSFQTLYELVLIARQGVTKRCRLSWLTNSALVNELKCRGRGGVAGSQPMSTAVHRSPNKLWRSNSIFDLCWKAFPKV